MDGNLLLRVLDLHVGFFSYGYPLLEPADSVEGVAVASVVDVGMMKLDALISRGSRKDFYDLYVVAQQIPSSHPVLTTNALSVKITPISRIHRQ